MLDCFVERVAEMADGEPAMNCRLCKYRAQMVGYEADAGAPQAGHHHHVRGIGTDADHAHDHHPAITMTMAHEHAAADAMSEPPRYRYLRDPASDLSPLLRARSPARPISRACRGELRAAGAASRPCRAATASIIDDPGRIAGRDGGGPGGARAPAR